MKQIFLTILLCATIGLGVFAQKSPVYNTDAGSINGYDPVAYFKAGKPEKGKPEYRYQWNGGDWWFSSKTNLDAFKASPEKYAPVYGGYCAFGMADGHKAPTDPAAWTIVDGKLYLNYNPAVKKIWAKDISGHIAKAEKNWPLLKDKE